MRRPPVITALFPGIRGRILAAMLVRPEKWWYLSEFSAFLKTQPSSLQREMRALTEAGILEQWRDGRRVYLRPDTRSPVFIELKGLFDKTEGIIPILEQVIQPFGEHIQLAFVYGSMARSAEKSESDVDLLVIGTVGLADLIPALRVAEQTVGRPVNATVFTGEEFRRKAQSHDHFLSAVLGEAKEFVKGSEDELEAILGQR